MSYDGPERRDNDRRLTRIEDNMEKITKDIAAITTENAVMAEHVNNLTNLMEVHCMKTIRIRYNMLLTKKKLWRFLMRPHKLIEMWQ